MEDKLKKFDNLTPTSEVDLSIYKEALDYAFEDNAIKIIGVTGSYGSGKSSVLESYKIQDTRSYMNISLANFKEVEKGIKEKVLPQESDDIFLEIKDNDKNIVVLQPEKDGEDYQNIIEGKIVNQLLHQINPKNIPQTIFKVKTPFSKKRAILIAVFISVLVASLMYLFNFGAWNMFIRSMFEIIPVGVYSFSTSPLGVIVASIAVVIVAFFSTIGVVWLISVKRFLKRVSIQGNEIEILHDAEESYFDKYLNEILYLFEHSGVEIFIFEDLDRYENGRIFTRLREINLLLNNKRDSKEKPIKFVFLLRDDMFKTKDRTKFFDFIIPIVPVIDSSNSYDKLKAHLEKRNVADKFNHTFLQEVCLYIDDFRILKNICNEYMIYKEKVGTVDQLDDKLLAMVIYKNFFPKEFSDLQINRGYIYEIFERKNVCVEEFITDMEEQIQKLNDIIVASEEEHLLKEAEVDIIYKEELSRYLVNSQKTKELREIINQRKENIRNKDINKRNELEQKIKNLKDMIIDIKDAELYQIIDNLNKERLFGFDQLHKFKYIIEDPYFGLIQYFISNGHIDENYYDYMSYFYENSLSKEDKRFVVNVLQHNALPWTHLLNNPKLVLKSLQESYFKRDEILNYSLAKYLVENQDKKTTQKFNNLLRRICQTGNVLFLIGYQENYVDDYSLWSAFIEHYPDQFSRFIYSEDMPVGNRDNYVYEILNRCSNNVLSQINKGGVLSKHVETEPHMLCVQNISLGKIIPAFRLLDIKIVNLNIGAEYEEFLNQGLLKAIYENEFYLLNYQNVCFILKHFEKIKDEKELTHRNLTAVFTTPLLQRYVTENIETYITEIVENCAEKILDDEHIVITFANMKNIDENIKEQYYQLLQTKIASIKKVTNIADWSLLLKYRIVEYSEENVVEYWKNQVNDVDKDMCEFINDYGTSFDFNAEWLNEKYGEEASIEFYEAAIRAYDMEDSKYIQIIKALGRKVEKMVGMNMPDNKARLLLSNDLIQMTKDNLKYVRATYQDCVNDYVKNHIMPYLEIVKADKSMYIRDEMLAVLDSNVSDEQKLELLFYEQGTISIQNKKYSEPLLCEIIKKNFDANDLQYLVTNYNNYGKEVQNCLVDKIAENIDAVIDGSLSISMSLVKSLCKMQKISIDDRILMIQRLIPSMNPNDCYECMRLVGLHKLSRVLYGEHPAIPCDSITEDFLKALQRRGWISNFYDVKSKENMIRVYGRHILPYKKGYFGPPS